LRRVSLAVVREVREAIAVRVDVAVVADAGRVRAAAVETVLRRRKLAMTQGMRVALRRGPLPLLAVLWFGLWSGIALGQAPEQVAPGVWFLLGDPSKGYSNTAVIEMRDYLIVVDANYPGRAKELIALMPSISPKPVRYVFDTHAHGDHSYGNSTWTKAGATTMAFRGVAGEMARWEPGRWQTFGEKREDVRATGEHDVERPKKIIDGDKFVLNDGQREVDFLFLGWGHTPGDGFVWLPKERVLATGDAAVNGPRNKLADASIANWPKVLDKAIALGPKFVLPGHGPRGGVEILTGQKQFLLDLYTAVAVQLAQGKVGGRIAVTLPERDANWIPKDLTLDVEATTAEIEGKAPAGSLPHVWK
jgi:glyoxylase-like metal-dependent hydrolase (beta-lactamase superfamily II)